MKNIFALIFFCLFMYTVSAQNQDELYKTIAKETCECVSKRNVDLSKREDVEIALGLCMIESAQRNNMDFEMTDEEAMQKLGEKVGLQMAPICPDLFRTFINGNEETETLSITGRIKSVETGDFLYIHLKEEGGKEHKLIWLRYFVGSDEFIDDPKKLIGKNVTITYQNLECFSPKAKVYYNNKEITELQIN